MIVVVIVRTWKRGSDREKVKEGCREDREEGEDEKRRVTEGEMVRG